MHPNEAVNYGASVQATILTDQINHDIRDLMLWDVTTLSIGVRIANDEIILVVPRNTTIPTKKEKVFATHYDYQTSLSFPVYEGERRRASDNIMLDRFVLSGYFEGLPED